MRHLMKICLLLTLFISTIFANNKTVGSRDKNIDFDASVNEKNKEGPGNVETVSTSVEPVAQNSFEALAEKEPLNCRSYLIQRQSLYLMGSNETDDAENSTSEKKPSRIPPQQQSYHCAYTVCTSKPSGVIDETAKITIENERPRDLTAHELAVLKNFTVTQSDQLNVGEKDESPFFEWDTAWRKFKQFFSSVSKSPPCICPSCPKEAEVKAQ